jgi:hypothetical protein
MKRKVRETELKTIFDRIDQVQLNEADKRLAKAYLVQADRLVELALGVTTGVKRLTDLAIVKAVRRGITHVSKTAH